MMMPPKQRQPPFDPFGELLAWKLAGAAAWHTALFLLAAIAWHVAAAPGSPLLSRGLLSFAGLARLLLFYATTLAVLLAQRRLLATGDAPPVHAPRLGLTARGAGGLFVSRCLLRGRTAADAAALAALYAAAALSGAVGVAAGAAALTPPSSGSGGRNSSGSGSGSGWLAAYGASLGLAYAALYLFRAKNVLAHPIAPRPRYFRVKGRARAGE